MTWELSENSLTGPQGPVAGDRASSRAVSKTDEPAELEAELVELAGDDGGHRRHVDPDSAAWAVVTRWLERRAGDPAAGHRVGLGSDADE